MRTACLLRRHAFYEHSDPLASMWTGNQDSLAQRGAQLPVTARLLAQEVSHRRAARRRGRLHALFDYSREGGEWIPNKYGGRENLDAISFIRRFNEVTHGEAPGIITVAEESTLADGHA